MESFCLQNFNCLVSTHDYVTLISFYSQRFCHGVRLLEKVVLQDNLSTLVVNLYPRSEGYSLMLKGKTSIPSALSVKGQRFIAFNINGQQIFPKIYQFKIPIGFLVIKKKIMTKFSLISKISDFKESTRWVWSPTLTVSFFHLLARVLLFTLQFFWASHIIYYRSKEIFQDLKMMKSSTTYLACTLRRKITAFCLKTFMSISDLMVKLNSSIRSCEIFFSSIFFSHNNLLLIFNYFWSTDSETVRLPYEVNWVLQFLLVLQDGLRWLQLLFNLQYCGTTCSFSTGCLHVPSNVHLRNKWNKTGAPNDDFLLNTLKTLFRLSRVVLDLKKYILSGGIKLDSVRSP